MSRFLLPICTSGCLFQPMFNAKAGVYVPDPIKISDGNKTDLLAA